MRSNSSGEVVLEDAGAHAAARLNLWLLLFVWIAFWTVLYLLGLQTFRWEGGREIRLLNAKYATAFAVCTFIGVAQLRQTQRMGHLIGQPIRWFSTLWRWLPVDLTLFALAMFLAPRALGRLFDFPFDNTNWQRGDAYDCVEFLVFYLLSGGIQFGVRSYRAWLDERVHAAEHARFANEAQLTLLTQQLQPHFLFNGLNLISSLIHTDPDLADTLLGRLATLLRAATGAAARAQQPLAEELLLLQAYADIMTQRFAGRVLIDWDIDDGARPCLVPTFGLQPLLENCFQHVVERRAEPTHIVIRAKRYGNRLRIEFDDDGERVESEPRRGVGLGNLERRLASLHGHNASLTLLAKSTRGLTVVLDIPCEW